MKYTILFLWLIIYSSAHAQINKTGYRIQTEYKNDSSGQAIIPIPLEELEYHRITAEDNSSWGYRNRAGEIVIPLGKYKFLNPIDSHGMILAHKNGKEGFIDITEKILIPFIYDDIGVFSKSVELAPVIQNGKQGFINRQGKIVIPLEYDATSHVTYFYDPGVAILMKNGKYGVIDPHNNAIIPFKYDNIEWSDNKDCFIVTLEDSWTSFSFDGRQLSDFNNYIIISETSSSSLPADSKDLPILVTTEESQIKIDALFSNMDYLNGTKETRDSIEISVSGEYAYIDKSLKTIVPFGTYDHAEPFGLGRKAIVARKGLYGIIDEHGKIVLPLEYNFIERPSQYSRYADIFIASKEYKVTIFNKDAHSIPVQGIVSYIHWNGDIFITDAHRKTGLLNYKGQQTIPFEYDTLYNSRSGGFIARKGDKYGYISNKNKILRPFDYMYIYSLDHGLAFVNSEKKVGMYNTKGDVVILPFEYDAIHNTYYNKFDKNETRYIVAKSGKVGTVDIHNRIIIPLIYDALSGWVEYGPDAHFARQNGKYGLVSHEGEVIIPIEYDYVGIPVNGVIVVRKNGKYGAVSWENEEILPCIYDNLIDDIPYFDFGEEKQEPKLIALQNNIWNYFDLKGKLIRTNAPEKEIIKRFDYRFEWGEPSNEVGFDMKGAEVFF